MASQIKRMWLHDEDNAIKILPYTTLDNIKIQPDVEQDEFLEFKDDYTITKNTITNNKNQTDSAINNLDRRVAVLENNSSTSSSAIATHSANGLMSKEDKVKLDTVEENANNYVLPPASSNRLGGIKVDDTTTFIDNDGTLHAAGGAGGATTLDNLLNVEIDAILDGDILQYDHRKKKWINTMIDMVSGSGTVNEIDSDDIIGLFNTEDINYIYDIKRTY